MSKTYYSKNLQRRINKAFDMAVLALKENINFPQDCWFGYGLDEPLRSQTWQRAKEYVKYEQGELFYEDN